MSRLRDERSEMEGRVKKKRKGWLAVCIICVVAAVVCAGFVIGHYAQRKEDAEKNRTLTEQVRKTEAPEETKQPQEEPPINYVDIPVDFETACAQNSDIYAWITIPGTLVDYPVVQSGTDDAFYLTHGIDGEKNASGCIYSESLNAKDFTDPHTVLYGHNMKNDTMFGSLHSYEDRAFFDANRTIYIYTPTEKLTYQIFAAYPWSSEHLLNVYDTKNPEAFRMYLDQVKAVRGMHAFVDETASVDETSSILTLSTCIGVNNNDSRYLVQGVLVAREPGKYQEEAAAPQE